MRLNRQTSGLDVKANLPSKATLPLVAGVAAAIGLVLAGCGGRTSDRFVAPDAGPIHAHGIGADPADGTLYVATHTGLYSLPAGETRYTRVRETFEDLMSFSVAGPGRLLASGHPDVQEAVKRGLPPHLGLVESTDGGTSWTTLGLQGKADFHLLRVGGDTVYGVDATSGRLMSTTDNGRTWGLLELPGRLVDLAVRAGQSNELVATTEDGLAGSSDGGRSWQSWDGHPGLLAWPLSDRLYSLGFDGRVTISRDGGRTWTDRRTLGSEPTAVTAAGPDHLYAVLHDATIVESVDGGETWTVRATSAVAS